MKIYLTQFLEIFVSESKKNINFALTLGGAFTAEIIPTELAVVIHRKNY